MNKFILLAYCILCFACNANKHEIKVKVFDEPKSIFITNAKVLDMETKNEGRFKESLYYLKTSEGNKIMVYSDGYDTSIFTVNSKIIYYTVFLKRK